ncbi:hypothetical protein AALD01_06665 [Oscillospiraceae bacterium 21-37]|uniref:hypothetical protein n=1 Tax=unclassified Neglectibacter TaxID=2632164 RepID=UPI00136A7FE7|nr:MULTISPECIES: hypothetical protein [unclassified Neglectibacter]NBI18122.1 hypothetical protein [Neglectibacter sp. 59]NBJ73799.1 hypothetical protein [Neglectibacter sp. X4]NCE81491.1 hypothetical protein [Neglectibacter sp. X58]
MDLKKAGEWVKKALQKENALRWAVILGICGIALLALSSLDLQKPQPQEQQAEEAEDGTAYARALEADLSRIVTAITGEHSPAVMITLENSGRRVFAADKRESGQQGGDGAWEKESSHVLVEDEKGSQRPLTVTETQPKIQGVVIVSAKAGDPAIREKLVNAAKTALGVPSSRVCVTCGG